MTLKSAHLEGKRWFTKNIGKSGKIQFFFKKYFIYLFLDRGEEREKERERHKNMWLPLTCPTLGNLARNPGMCPDWESNQQLFGSQAGTQPPSNTSQGYGPLRR